MTDPGDLERRVSALEQEVTRLQGELDQAREDTEAARVLAGGADRDVSDVRSQLRAQRGLLQALRHTQVEQSDRLDRLERRMTAVELRLTALEDRLAGMDARLTGRMDELSGRIDSLESEMRQGFAKLGAGMTHIVTLLERDADEG
jgi:chromosome segregation ATPase